MTKDEARNKVSNNIEVELLEIILNTPVIMTNRSRLHLARVLAKYIEDLNKGKK